MEIILDRDRSSAAIRKAPKPASSEELSWKSDEVGTRPDDRIRGELADRPGKLGETY
jgi:hypothetical protein